MADVSVRRATMDDYEAIENLVVDAEHRRQGIGTELVEAARQWARGHGLPDIQLMELRLDDE